MTPTEIQTTLDQLYPHGMKCHDGVTMTSFDDRRAFAIYTHYYRRMPDANPQILLEHVIHDLQGRNDHPHSKMRKAGPKVAPPVKAAAPAKAAPVVVTLPKKGKK